MKRDVTLLLGGTVLGAIGTLLVNLATGWFQAKEARLVYEATETLPIQDKDQSTAIYHV